MPNRRESLTGAGARYRALLEITSATASEPNVEEMLHSMSAVLSGIIPVRLIGLLLLEERRGIARLHALETDSHFAIESVTELPLAGAAGLAIEEQRPFLFEDGQTELQRFPDLIAVLKGASVHSLYAFPLSTSRRRLGALLAATKSSSLSKDDLELVSGRHRICLSHWTALSPSSRPASTSAN